MLKKIFSFSVARFLFFFGCIHQLIPHHMTAEMVTHTSSVAHEDGCIMSNGFSCNVRGQLDFFRTKYLAHCTTATMQTTL